MPPSDRHRDCEEEKLPVLASSSRIEHNTTAIPITNGKEEEDRNCESRKEGGKMKTVRLADGTEGEVEDYEAVLGQYVTIELRDESGMPYEADGEIVEILELGEEDEKGGIGNDIIKDKIPHRLLVDC